MRRAWISILVIAVSFWRADPAHAGARWIEDTLSTDLRKVVSDEVRDRVYVADVGSSEIIILDSVNESVLARIPVPPPLFDLTLSKDGRYLLASAGSVIVRMDRDLLVAETFPLPPGVPRLLALAVDASGNVIGLGFRTHAFIIDLDGGQVLSEFGWGLHSFDFPLAIVETDRSGRTLWIVTTSLNPSSVWQFDVSDPLAAVELGRGDRTVGSFARDFVVSPNRDELYIAPGNPYGIQCFDTTALTVSDQIIPDVFIGGPPAVALDRSGESLFFSVSSVYTPDRVFHYRVADRVLLAEYPLEARTHNGLTRSRGLALERRGRKLFVAHGSDSQFSRRSQVQVVDVGRRVQVDIRPGSRWNRLRPQSRGVLPVAILSSETFDATDFDPLTLRLGPGEASVFRGRARFQDVDGDGLLDLVVGFRIAATAIDCGDREAVLHGIAMDGVPIYGSDAVFPIGCR